MFHIVLLFALYFHPAPRVINSKPVNLQRLQCDAYGSYLNSDGVCVAPPLPGGQL